MKQKKLIDPRRVRRVPPQFSWIDQRLLRDNHFQRCRPTAWALYLFLLTVADAQGLSYYSDASIGRYLQLPTCELQAARSQLIAAGLIAFQKPFYQVLDLDPDRDTAQGVRQGSARTLKQLFEHAIGGPND